MREIDVKGVSKRFKGVQALDQVSMRFERNTIYGLLGRNGAGKSTLLNLISNRIFADDGSITIDGMKACENDIAQNNLYLMSEKDYYPESIRVKQVFQWTQEFYGCFDLAKANALADTFGLDTKKKVSKLSTGYKSIYKNITALSLNVPYIFLDEPVLGLDANHRDLFYRLLLEEYSDNPRSFIISTHLIEEVSKIIEKVIVLKQGRVIKDTTAEELIQMGYSVAGPRQEAEAYAQARNIIGAESLGGLQIYYILGIPEPEQASDRLEFTAMDLQKLFIQLTND